MDADRLSLMERVRAATFARRASKEGGLDDLIDILQNYARLAEKKANKKDPAQEAARSAAHDLKFNLQKARKNEKTSPREMEEWFRSYLRVEKQMKSSGLLSDSESTAIKRKEKDDKQREDRRNFDDLGDKIRDGINDGLMSPTMERTIESGADKIGEQGASGIKIGLAGLLGKASPLVVMLGEMVDLEKLSSSAIKNLAKGAWWSVKKAVTSPLSLLSTRVKSSGVKEEEKRQKKEEEKKKVGLLEKILHELSGGRHAGKASAIGKLRGWALKAGALVSGVASFLLFHTKSALMHLGRFFYNHGFKIVMDLGAKFLTGAWGLLRNVGGKVIGLVTKGLGKLAFGALRALGTIFGAAEGLITGAAIVAAVVGIGYLAWKYRAKIKEWALDIWHGITHAVGKMWDWAKHAIEHPLDTVHGLVNNVRTTADTAMKTAASVGHAIKTMGHYIAPYAEGAWALAKNAIRMMAGTVSAMFESGANAGAVSSGKGDLGGRSYGLFQFSSRGGDNSTVARFLKQSGYSSQFMGLKVGSSEFNDQWRKVAKNDKYFSLAQQKFAAENYYKPQLALLKRDGYDLTGRGAAVQNAVWSNAVQYGARSTLIEKALQGKNLASMSDADIIRAIYRYKKQNVGVEFRSSSQQVQAGVANRYGQEERQLLSMARTQSGDIAYNRTSPRQFVPSNGPEVANNTAVKGEMGYALNASTIPSYVSDEGLLILNSVGLAA